MVNSDVIFLQSVCAVTSKPMSKALVTSDKSANSEFLTAIQFSQRVHESRYLEFQGTL